MDEFLVTAGVIAMIGAVVGGGLKLAGAELPSIIDSKGRQVLLGVLGAGLFAVGLSGGETSGLPPGDFTGGTSTTTTQTRGDSRPITAPATTTTPPLSGCVVTIENPLLSLREEPDRFAQEIVRVPPGDYAVERSETVAEVRGSQRWLSITVQGRQGWIPDDTFTVEAKSPACP